MNFFVTFQNVAVLFLLIILGFAAGKIGLLSLQGQKEVTRLVLYVTLPATIIMALQRPYDAQKMQTSLKIMGIMVLVYLLLLVLAYVISRRYRLAEHQKDVLMIGSILSNTVFMGYPVVLNLLGEDALFFAVIGSGLVFEIFAWTAGVYFVSRSSKKQGSHGLYDALKSPGVLAIAVGFLLFILRIEIPQPFSRTFGMLASATSPVAMLMVGSMLSRSDIRGAVKNPWLFVTSALKLLVYPGIVLLLLRLLGFRGVELIIPVIMVGMPTAAYLAMFCERYDNDAALASQQVFLSSLLSLVTIPVLAMLASL